MAAIAYSATCRVLGFTPTAPLSGSGSSRRRGLTFLLDWLEAQPGATWQERWLASGADTAWRQGPAAWLQAQGLPAAWRQEAAASALLSAISADIVRPALGWLVAKGTGQGGLVRHLARARDPEGFARLRAACDAGPHVSRTSGSHTIYRAAELVAAKGGQLADITVGDILELLDTELATLASVGDVAVSYQLLRTMGIFGQDAPASWRELRSAGPRTPAELIGRYHLKCRPVRDLLVEYLRERQPAMDYGSLKSLACILGMLFWQDLERHNPGISSLRLPADVAGAWKQRLQTKPKMITNAAGGKTQAQVTRLNYWGCLIPIRAFYLDLAQWAVEDPGRWGPWAVPCPIREEETSERDLIVGSAHPSVPLPICTAFFHAVQMIFITSPALVKIRPDQRKYSVSSPLMIPHATSGEATATTSTARQ